MTQRLAVRRPTRAPGRGSMLVQLYSAALFAATHPCGLDARDGDIDALAQMSWPVGLQIPLSRTTCFIRGPSRAAQQPSQDDMTPKRQTSLDVLIMPALSRQAEADCRCVSSELRCERGTAV